MRIELEGQAVNAEALWSVVSSYGHFTAMQVRGRRTRGLAHHLDRLEAANKELFGAELDRERIRRLIQHALDDVDDASVRVYVYESEPEPVFVVTVKEPGGVSTPQKLQSVRYQRPDAHLKHLATGQSYYARVARRNGFDDALLTASDGTISETTIANIGFLDGSGVVWPEAPLLRGITMQLLEESVPSTSAPVRLQDLASFDGAFLSNSRGIAAVSRVDEVDVPMQPERIQTIVDAYESASWDDI